MGSYPVPCPGTYITCLVLLSYPVGRYPRPERTDRFADLPRDSLRPRRGGLLTPSAQPLAATIFPFASPDFTAASKPPRSRPPSRGRCTQPAEPIPFVWETQRRRETPEQPGGATSGYIPGATMTRCLSSGGFPRSLVVVADPIHPPLPVRMHLSLLHVNSPTSLLLPLRPAHVASLEVDQIVSGTRHPQLGGPVCPVSGLFARVAHPVKSRCFAACGGTGTGSASGVGWLAKLGAARESPNDRRR